MLLTFTPDCAHAVLSGRISISVLREIDRALTFNEVGARFTPQFKRGLWDGKTHLFDAKHQIIPAGLVHRVLPVLEALGIEPDIEDARPSPPWGSDPPELVTTLHDEKRGTITLEPDQVAAGESILENVRGLVEMATSGGKTEIIAAVFKTIPGARALMIADRWALVEQTRDRLEERLQERVGLYGGGFKQVNRRVTVSTVQSLAAHRKALSQNLGFFREQQIVVYDEAHGVSEQANSVLKLIPAPVRIGLSATIKEATRRMVVESYLGPIIFEEELATLVALGRAAQPHVSMIRVHEPIDEIEDPANAYWHGIVTSKHRNDVIIDAALRCIARSLPFLILCVRLEHGRILAHKFEQAGLGIPFMRGGMSLTEVVMDIDAGRLPGVIMSTIGDQGIDMPNVRALIVGGGFRSPLRTMQRLGRSVRKKTTGENAVDVLDMMDTGHRTIKSQADDRRRTYTRKKMTPRIIDSLDDWLR